MQRIEAILRAARPRVRAGVDRSARSRSAPPPGAALRRPWRPRSGRSPAASTQLSTTGGTSDGRFIATICRQVIEFGPPNASVHKIDEHIAVADLEPLKDIYRGALERLLT